MSILSLLNFNENFQVSFSIPPEAIPGRLGMLLVIFLCMINTMNSVSKNSPQADSGPTVLVIWMVVCISFLMIAIVEYAWIINFYLRKQRTFEVQTDKSESWPEMTKMDRIDRIMGISFPVVFIFATVIFWCVA